MTGALTGAVAGPGHGHARGGLRAAVGRGADRPGCAAWSATSPSSSASAGSGTTPWTCGAYTAWAAGLA